MRMVDAKCLVCGNEGEGLQRGKTITPCPECGGQRERFFRKAHVVPAAVHGDDIPGGMTFKHGICNEDGTPKTYYTRHEIAEAKKKAGVLSMEDTGHEIPVTTDEIDRMLSRPGYKQAPRIVAMPGTLSPEDEAKRLAHWHADEARIQREQPAKEVELVIPEPAVHESVTVGTTSKRTADILQEQLMLALEKLR
jgi:hypothetical protein